MTANTTTQGVTCRQQHEAASTIADAFQADPLFMKAFRNTRARYVATYTIAAAFMGTGTGSADVLVNHTTNVLTSTCLWEETVENYRLGVVEMGVRNVIMAFSVYYYMVKGATYSVGFSKQVGGLLNAIPVILYGVCTFWVVRFLFEFFRMAFVYGFIVYKGDEFIGQYEKEFGKLGKSCKHLSMIGTLETARGQGIGSTLIKYSLDNLDKSNIYDYYYLESSNPKNVPFYERHGFIKIGELKVMGEMVTYMIRKNTSNMA